ncbi:MAG: chaperone modulator CbpM [Deltaproteobacteria bacterium]
MNIIKIHYHDNEEYIPLANFDLHPDIVALMEDLGLIETSGELISTDYAWRINKILRLKKALGLNLNGAAIIVDLLDRIEELDSELRTLRKMR